MGNGAPVSHAQAAAMGITTTILNKSVHEHVLHLVENSGSTSCDRCRKSCKYFYQCAQCGIGHWDLCMSCYSNVCTKENTLTDEDQLRCYTVLSDRNKRQQVIEKISSNLPNLSEDDQRIVNITLEILKNDKIDAVAISRAVNTVLAAEVKDEIKQEVITELGLDQIDPTGLFSALSLVKSIAKGDINGTVNGVAGLVVGKMLFAAVCSIS